jgi:hypothetical protein
MLLLNSWSVCVITSEVDIPLVLLPWLQTFIYVNVVVVYVVYPLGEESNVSCYI